MSEKLKCWIHFNCREKDCPAYKRENARCWMTPGAHCRHEISGLFRNKMDICIDCESFKKNMDGGSMEKTIRILNEQLKRSKFTADDSDREEKYYSREMTAGLSEVFESLQRLSSGDPLVRLDEVSRHELIPKIKHLVNLAAENLAEITELSHEFAIGLVEHFDVLHRVSIGDLTARITGSSNVELLDSLKKLTNHMIESVDRAINERRQADEALRESEKRYRTLFNQANDAIFVEDEKGLIIDVNSRACEMLNYSRADLIGKKLTELQDPDSERHRGTIVKTFLRRKTSPPIKSNTKKERRRWIPVEISTSHLTGQESGLVMSIVRDITERQLAEATIKESEERYRRLYEESRKAEEVYRSLINSSADAIVIHDLQGRVQYISPSFTQMFGWNSEELLGGKIPYVPDEDMESSQTIINSLIEYGKPCRGFETRRYTKDGRVLNINLSASRYDDHEGKPAGILVNLHDITETKKLQAQLQQAQKMEAIGTLASGISHDFNNILQAISGYIQLLSNKGDNRGKGRRYLQEVDIAVQRASDLVHRLLTFGRKVEPCLGPVDLNQEVRRTVEMLERTIPKMIRITTDLAEDLKTCVGDANQIEQIIMNLSTNARDSISDEGTIHIHTKNITLDESFKKVNPEMDSREYLLLQVTDTGAGMDKETAQHIFEPFFTTKEVGKGTGLGLSIVYGIVKNHNGHINCYSEPGMGTSFSIYLPQYMKEYSQTTAAVEPVIDYYGNSETILLVDDEDSIIEIAEDILQSYGYSTLTAHSGEETIEIYNEIGNQIDLVILDLGMPGMGGHNCLKELIRIDPDLAVIIASGYSKEGLAEDVLDSGARDFIGKPYRLSELLKKVRNTLNQNTESIQVSKTA